MYLLTTDIHSPGLSVCSCGWRWRPEWRWGRGEGEVRVQSCQCWSYIFKDNPWGTRTSKTQQKTFLKRREALSLKWCEQKHFLDSDSLAVCPSLGPSIILAQLLCRCRLFDLSLSLWAEITSKVFLFPCLSLHVIRCIWLLWPHSINVDHNGWLLILHSHELSVLVSRPNTE